MSTLIILIRIMDFGGFLLVVCGLIVLVASVGMCAKCRGGRTGKADITSTPGTSKSGQDNTAVVVGSD